MALHLTQVLIKPLITEKNNVGREARNEVVFEVHPHANKKTIQQAVEQLFAVEVQEVRTIHKKGKARRVGRFSGFRPDVKKAIVKLKPGHDVDFFQTT